MKKNRQEKLGPSLGWGEWASDLTVLKGEGVALQKKKKQNTGVLSFNDFVFVNQNIWLNKRQKAKIVKIPM